jgi:mannose-6-phosphate isomerase-like protein (cupin superfamily)
MSIDASQPVPPAPQSSSLSSLHSREPAGGEGAGYELVDFAGIPGVPCPCGTARRAFADVADYPGTIHVTEIAEDARLHYHRRLTETYYFLECEPDAAMQLDDVTIPVHPGMCILIRPGTRHRAIGKMKVLIVVFPKFDPTDEWFDERGQK